jgi:hypothetical protein
VITVEMDNSDLAHIRERLAQLPPRLLRRTYAALRPLIKDALLKKLNNHFAGCGPTTVVRNGREVPPPTHPTKLTNRSNNLFWSVYRSLKMSSSGTDFRLSIGSDLCYAAIHEYGGFAGRCPPFKKPDGHRPYIHPRPYLQPTIDDLVEVLPDLLETAIRRAQASL